MFSLPLSDLPGASRIPALANYPPGVTFFRRDDGAWKISIFTLAAILILFGLG